MTIIARRANRSIYLIGHNIPVSDDTSILVQRDMVIFENWVGRIPYLKLHKFVLQSKLLVYVLGYLVISVQVLTISQTRTIENNMPNRLIRMVTCPTMSTVPSFMIYLR
uniref:Uncharacterized protein n=1 Tax=Heliothis virescens TaxID=7102 RepID=A0A2A4IZA7_HELVI